MRGIICYHSNTGNTLLVSQKLAGYLSLFPVELCNMDQSSPINPLQYDFFGFASPVEYFGLPSKTLEWISRIPRISQLKYAFVLLTHGGLPGTALIKMKEIVQSRNLRVIATHALQCPESYPPLRSRGFRGARAPSSAKLRRFSIFASILQDLILSASEGREILEAKFKLSFISYFFGSPGLDAAKHMMGYKYLDKSLCSLCMLCIKSCPHSAIRVDHFPIFSEEACKGCWKCYNLCPTKAIYTRYLRGRGHYRSPDKIFQHKMKEIGPFDE